MPKTDQQIVDEVNAIARMNLRIIGTGYQVSAGHRFYEATDPRSKLAWNHAVEVYEFLTGTEVGTRSPPCRRPSRCCRRPIP